MFVVLVTDFASLNQIFGPFATREEARRWAETNVRDIYRVAEVSTPGEVPVTVARQQSD